MTGMDFCRSDAFGHRGERFACQWGTLANLNAMGAFAVAEQLGFALGYPAIPEITFPIIHMK
jgi:hypothetical protein